MADRAKKAVKNAQDAVREIGHRANAGMEKATRKIAGDQMTGGEKVKSVMREDVENTKADVDHAKRKVRGG